MSRYGELKETLLRNLQIAEGENNWRQVDQIHNLLDEIIEEEYAEEARLTG